MKTKTTLQFFLTILISSQAIAQKKSIMAADLMTYKARGLSEDLLKASSDYLNKKKEELDCVKILSNEERDKVASDAGYFANWENMNQRSASGMIENISADGYMTFGILNGEAGKVNLSIAYQIKGSNLNYWKEAAEPNIDAIKKALDTLFANVCK